MNDDDDLATKSTPPKNADDWAFLWSGAKKGHLSWIIARPFHAVWQNWPVLIAIISLLAWLNKGALLAPFTSLLAAINAMTGGLP